MIPTVTMDLPLVCRVRRKLPAGDVVDLPAQIAQEWARLDLAGQVAGKRIALGIGSRGVAGIDVIARELVGQVRRSGGHPFIVPAMGSHGGATAEGQRDVLHSLGVTEERVGCPIRRDNGRGRARRSRADSRCILIAMPPKRMASSSPTG